MVSITISLSSESEKLLNALTSKKYESLKPAFEQIGDVTRQWFGDNIIVRGYAGMANEWRDLSPKWKEQKEKKYGFVYPMLFASGSLYKSYVDSKNKYNISDIKDKSASFGSKEPKAAFHEYGGMWGSRPVPSRPMTKMNNMLNSLWGEIIRDYYAKQLIADGVSVK